MVLSSFECWATCEADSIRDFSNPRNRSVDYFKPPEVSYVSQSCYHGYSRVIDNNNQSVVQDPQPMDVVAVAPISSPAVPSRKRCFVDSDRFDVHEKSKQPKLAAEGKFSFVIDVVIDYLCCLLISQCRHRFQLSFHCKATFIA